MVNRFLRRLTVFLFCLSVLLISFFLFNQPSLRAQYDDDGGDDRGDGGGDVVIIPSCTSWVSIKINDCTKQKFNATPRDPDCITNSRSVTLTINSGADNYSNLLWTVVNDRTPNNECPSSGWSKKAPFTAKIITTPWELLEGDGNKKVCLKIYKVNGDLWRSACSAKIELKFLTPTPSPPKNLTPTHALTPTPVSPFWYKIKNGSFYKNSAINFSVPAIISSFDNVDDTNQPFLIIGNAGVVFSNNTISFNNPDFKTNINEWRISYYERNYGLNLIDNFIDYAKSRKEYQFISVLEDNGSNLVEDKVNILNSGDDLSLTNNHLAAAPDSFVLIVQGNININEDFNTTINPKSVALIASGDNATITFDEGVTKAGGIFIAPKIIIKDAINPADGLKIKGNLITDETATLLRDRNDNSKPTYFIVFDPKMYLDLLPLLSISTYDWQQTQ